MALAMSPAVQSQPQAAGWQGESARQGAPALVAEGAHTTTQAASHFRAQKSRGSRTGEAQSRVTC